MSSDFTGIDGDTFDTGDERVRLIGVDTPEIGYNGEPDEPGAQKAKRVTQRFLDKNDVTLGRPTDPSYPKTDSTPSKRSLFYAESPEGKDLGAKLIRKGLAEPAYDSTDGYDFHDKENHYEKIFERSQMAPRPRNKTNVDKYDKLVQDYVKQLGGNHPVHEVKSLSQLIDAVELAPGIDPDSAMAYTVSTTAAMGGARPSAGVARGGGGAGDGRTNAELAMALANLNQEARANGALNTLEKNGGVVSLDDADLPEGVPTREEYAERNEENRQEEIATREEEDDAKSETGFQGLDSVVDFAQGMVRTAFAALDQAPEMASNMTANVAGAMMGGNPDIGVSQFTNTTFGRMMKGWGLFVKEGFQYTDEVENLVDWGDGWFFEYDSPAAKTKRRTDAERFGFDKNHPSYEAIKAGAATPGEVLSWHKTGGIHAYGVVDAMFYLADPTIFISGLPKMMASATRQAGAKVLPKVFGAAKPTKDEIADLMYGAGTEGNVLDAMRNYAETGDETGLSALDLQNDVRTWREVIEQGGLVGNAWDETIGQIETTSPLFAQQMRRLHTIATSDELIIEGAQAVETISPEMSIRAQQRSRTLAAELLQEQIGVYRESWGKVSESLKNKEIAERDYILSENLFNEVIDSVVGQIDAAYDARRIDDPELGFLNEGEETAKKINGQKEALRNHFGNMLKLMLKLPDDMQVTFDAARRPTFSSGKVGSWRFDIIHNPEWEKWGKVRQGTEPARFLLAESGSKRTVKNDKFGDPLEPGFRQPDSGSSLTSERGQLDTYTVYARGNNLSALYGTARGIQKGVDEAFARFNQGNPDLDLAGQQYDLSRREGEQFSLQDGLEGFDPNQLSIEEIDELGDLLSRGVEFRWGRTAADDAAEGMVDIDAVHAQRLELLEQRLSEAGYSRPRLEVDGDGYIDNVDFNWMQRDLSDARFPDIRVVARVFEDGKWVQKELNVGPFTTRMGDPRPVSATGYSKDGDLSELASLLSGGSNTLVGTRSRIGQVRPGVSVVDKENRIIAEYIGDVPVQTAEAKVGTDVPVMLVGKTNPNPLRRVTDESVIAKAMTDNGTPQHYWHVRRYNMNDVEFDNFVNDLAPPPARSVETPERQPQETIEVSTAGDEFGKQFSAFNAKVQLSDGTKVSVEDMYQRAKGYENAQAGKGQPAKNPDFDYYGTYLSIWRMWTEQNPLEFNQLVQKIYKGAKLKDKFARTENNQAAALTRLAMEALEGEGAARSLGALGVDQDAARASRISELTVEWEQLPKRIDGQPKRTAKAKRIEEELEALNRGEDVYEPGSSVYVQSPMTDLPERNFVEVLDRARIGLMGLSRSTAFRKSEVEQVANEYWPRQDTSQYVDVAEGRMAIPTLDAVLLRHFETIATFQRMGWLRVGEDLRKLTLVNDLPGDHPLALDAFGGQYQAAREYEGGVFVNDFGDEGVDNIAAVPETDRQVSAEAARNQDPNRPVNWDYTPPKKEGGPPQVGVGEALFDSLEGIVWYDQTYSINGVVAKKAWQDFIDDLRVVTEESSHRKPHWVDLKNVDDPVVEKLNIAEPLPGNDFIEQLNDDLPDVLEDFARSLVDDANKHTNGVAKVVGPDGKKVKVRSFEEIRAYLYTLMKQIDEGGSATPQNVPSVNDKIEATLKGVEAPFRTELQKFLIAMVNTNDVMRASGLYKKGERTRLADFFQYFWDAPGKSGVPDWWQYLGDKNQLIVFDTVDEVEMSRRAYAQKFGVRQSDVRSAEESADVQRYTKERGVWDADAEEVEKWNDSQARMVGDPRTFGNVEGHLYEDGPMGLENVADVDPRVLYNAEHKPFSDGGGVDSASNTRERAIDVPMALYMSDEDYGRLVWHMTERRKPGSVTKTFKELRGFNVGDGEVADATTRIQVTGEQRAHALQVSSMPFPGARQVVLMFDETGSIIDDARFSRIDNAPMIDSVEGAEGALRRKVTRVQPLTTSSGEPLGYAVREVVRVPNSPASVTVKTQDAWRKRSILDFGDNPRVAHSFEIVDSRGNLVEAIANDMGNMQLEDVARFYNKTDGDAADSLINRLFGADEWEPAEIIKGGRHLESIEKDIVENGSFENFSLLMKEFEEGTRWEVPSNSIVGSRSNQFFIETYGDNAYIMGWYDWVSGQHQTKLFGITDEFGEKYDDLESAFSAAQARLKGLAYGQAIAEMVYKRTNSDMKSLRVPFDDVVTDAESSVARLESTVNDQYDINHVLRQGLDQNDMPPPLADVPGTPWENLGPKMTQALAHTYNFGRVTDQALAQVRAQVKAEEVAFHAEMDDVLGRQVDAFSEEVMRRSEAGEIGSDADALREFDEWFAQGFDNDQVYNFTINHKEPVPFGLKQFDDVPPGQNESLDALRALHYFYENVLRTPDRARVLEGALQHLFKIRRALVGGSNSPAVDYFLQLDGTQRSQLDRLTGGVLSSETINDLIAANNVDVLYEALGKALRNSGTGLNWDLGLQSSLKRTVMDITNQNPDAMYAKWYQWMAGVSRYTANRRISNVPWSTIGINANDDVAVKQATSETVGYLLSFNPGTRSTIVGGMRRSWNKRTGKYKGRDRKPNRFFNGADAAGWNGITVGSRKQDNAIREMFDMRNADGTIDETRPILNNQVHDYWMNRMIKAGSDAVPNMARRNVWNELMTDMVLRGGKSQGVSQDVLDVMVDAFKLVQREAQHVGYNNAAVSTLGKNQLISPGLTAEDSGHAFDAPLLEQEFSDWLATPDWRELRKVIKRAEYLKARKGGDDLKFKEKARGVVEHSWDELVGPLFDNYFRASVLAFRGSYMLRNVAEMQGRLMMEGMPSVARNPIGMLALAMNLNGGVLPQSIKDFLSPARFADEDIFGQQFGRNNRPDVDDDLLQDDVLLSAFDKIAMRETSRGDYGMYHYEQYHTRNLENMTFNNAMHPDDAKKFWAGVRRQQQLLTSDTISEMVFWVSRYARDGNQAGIREFGERAKKGWTVERVTDEGDVVEDHIYFAWMDDVWQRATSSAGDENLVPTFKQLQEALIEHLWASRKEGTLAEYISASTKWQTIADESYKKSNGSLLGPEQALDQLRLQVWGGDVDNTGLPKYANSSYGRLSQWTWNWDGDIVDVLAGPNVDQSAQLIGASKKAAAKKRSTLSDDEQATYMDGWEVPVTKFEVKAADQRKEEFMGSGLAAGVNWFFKKAAKSERGTTYLPAFRFKYWESISDYVEYLPPAQAEQIVAQAEKNLSGWLGQTGWKRGVNANAWAEKTLRKIRKNSKKATEDGSPFTMESVHGLAEDSATEFLARTFYDAAKRNQVGYALRIAYPFIQAFVNAIKWWSKAMIRNPQRPFRFGIAYSAAQSPGSKDTLGTVPDPFDWFEDENGEAKRWPWYDDNPSNPENSILFEDPLTEQQMIGIPFLDRFNQFASYLHPFTDPLPNGEAGLAAGRVPIESFNMVTMNQMVPGVGPIIQFPISRDVVQNSDLWINMPTVFKKSLLPFINVDPDRATGLGDLLVPAWAKSFLAGNNAGFEVQYTKYMGPVMAALRNADPERYGTTSESGYFISQAGMSRLIDDAKRVSRGMALSRGMFMNPFPGRVKYDMLVKNGQGEYFTQALLTAELRDLIEEEGSRADAIEVMADKYGMETLVAFFGKSSFSAPATQEAYEALGNIPGLDAHGTVASYFYPRGGYDPYYAKWANDKRDSTYDPDQMIASANEVLYLAQDKRIEQKYRKGEIDCATKKHYQSLLRAEANKHPINPKVTNGKDVTMNSIVEAMEQVPQLQQTDPGRAVMEFMPVYQRALALANDEDDETTNLDDSSGASGIDDVSAVNPTLSGEKNKVLRLQLLDKIESLVEKYPDSYSMMNRVFKPFIVPLMTDEDGLIEQYDPDCDAEGVDALPQGAEKYLNE